MALLRCCNHLRCRVCGAAAAYRYLTALCPCAVFRLLPLLTGFTPHTTADPTGSRAWVLGGLRLRSGGWGALGYSAFWGFEVPSLRGNGTVDHCEIAPGAGSCPAGMERTAYMHLQAGGRSGGPTRRVLRFSAFLSAAGQHGDRGEIGGRPRPRRHRPPRSATTSFCHRPPPPPQTAPQRARKNAAATDRPGTRGARFADWQKRRRHRPPRSATTSFYHRQPPPPQTAPQRNYCPTTRAAC